MRFTIVTRNEEERKKFVRARSASMKFRGTAPGCIVYRPVRLHFVWRRTFSRLTYAYAIHTHAQMLSRGALSKCLSPWSIVRSVTRQRPYVKYVHVKSHRLETCGSLCQAFAARRISRYRKSRILLRLLLSSD